MAPSQQQLDDFDAYARRPETWISASRGHLAVYEVLSDHLDRIRMQTPRPQSEFSGCWTAAYLHAGLAVENAVKASLIGTSPEIVQSGTLKARQFGSRSGHAIVDACESLLGSLTNVERRVLIKLEEFVLWAGKYNVPMNAAVLYNENSMNSLRNAPINEREIVGSLVARLQEAARAP